MTESVQDYSSRVAEEYSYRATQPIYVDGVRAYNEGHLVPKSNVELYGYDVDGLVEKVTPDVAPATDAEAASVVDTADAAAAVNDLATARARTASPSPTPPAASPVSTEKKD